MQTSTLPVGPGSLVDLIPSESSLEPAAESQATRDTTSMDFVVQTAGAEVACEQTSQLAPPSRPVERERRATAPKVARRAISRRTCSLMGVQIVGSGSYVPENIVTNA